MSSSNFRVLERPSFFTGKLLSVEDLQREQDYVRERLRRHNRFGPGWGVVAGLEVSLDEGPTVVVEPGLAIDCAGNELVVEEEVGLPLTGGFGRTCLVIRYVETPVGEVATPTGPQFTRVRESVVIEFASLNPNAGHRGIAQGTPGCGHAHAICIATLSRHGTRWTLLSASRGA